MPRYYTRACNFYYGNSSIKLVNKKKTLPLCQKKEISFDQIEILTRKSRRIIFINQIKNLSESLRKKISLDLKKIKSKKKNFSNFNFKKSPNLLGILNLTPDSFSDGGKFNTKKKGFYQSWYKDFPNQSKIEIKTLDRKLQQSLRPNYTIFNNSGQLQKLLLVHKAPDPAGFHHVALYNRDTEPSTDPEDNAFSFATGSYLTLGSNFFFFNKSLLVDEFFTGSLIAEDVIGTTVANQGSNPEATETSGFGG